MWHLNEVGVAEEHFATATTQLVMSQLYQHLPSTPSNGKVVVAGSVEGNAHDIGIRMIGDVLEAAGWRTVYLGASVPGRDFAEAVEHFGADLAAVSASLGSQLPSVVQAISCIRELGRPVPVLVGGRAFAAEDDSGGQPLWHRVGADGYSSSLQHAVQEAARLVGLK
jgi:methanogenic corrinoid protein MtbC1